MYEHFERHVVLVRAERGMEPVGNIALGDRVWVFQCSCRLSDEWTRMCWAQDVNEAVSKAAAAMHMHAERRHGVDFGSGGIPSTAGAEPEPSQPPAKRLSLQGDILHWLGTYGRFKLDQQGSGVDAGQEIWPTVGELHGAWHSRPDDLISALASLVLPTGGWPSYGAYRLVGELMGGTYRDGEARSNDRYVDVAKVGVNYVVSEGHPVERLSLWERSLLDE